MVRNHTPSPRQRKQETSSLEGPFARHFTVSQAEADKHGIEVDGKSKRPVPDNGTVPGKTRDIMIVTEESRRKHEEFMKYMCETMSTSKPTTKRKRNQGSIVTYSKS